MSQEQWAALGPEAQGQIVYVQVPVDRYRVYVRCAVIHNALVDWHEAQD